jgi:ubiquinone biosynthesis protein COQ9
MTDDPFFARLRGDAQPLRHQPDEATLSRIRARIQSRIAPRPSVAQLLAAWFRPLAAAAVALALASAIGIATAGSDDLTFGDPLEISMGGTTYSVSE